MPKIFGITVTRDKAPPKKELCSVYLGKEFTEDVTKHLWVLALKNHALSD